MELKQIYETGKKVVISAALVTVGVAIATAYLQREQIKDYFCDAPEVIVKTVEVCTPERLATGDHYQGLELVTREESDAQLDNQKGYLEKALEDKVGPLNKQVANLKSRLNQATTKFKKLEGTSFYSCKSRCTDMCQSKYRPRLRLGKIDTSGSKKKSIKGCDTGCEDAYERTMKKCEEEIGSSRETGPITYEPPQVTDAFVFKAETRCQRSAKRQKAACLEKCDPRRKNEDIWFGGFRGGMQGLSND